MPGADEERPESDDREQAYGLARLLALSDGVFAFALTLLVVQLAVPNLPPQQADQLGARLLDQAPSYFSYAVSFGVISLYWYQHHRIFRFVRRWDAWLIILNLGALMFIAVMPFPTAVLGRYGNQPLAVVVYAAVLGTTGLLAWLMWRYAISRGLVTPRLDRVRARQLLWRASIVPLVFFFSIPIAFWQPFLAEFSWSLSWIGIAVIARRSRARSKGLP